MQKTINGVTYTTFKNGKDAEKLGIDTTKKFIVVDLRYGFGNYKEGDIVEFLRPGAMGPIFKNSDGQEIGIFILWKELAYYDEPIKGGGGQAGDKAKFKVGDNIKTNTDGWQFFETDLENDRAMSTVASSRNFKEGLITKVSYSNRHHNWWYKIGDYSNMFDESCVELVELEKFFPDDEPEPTPRETKLTNTIITDIKDEEQHKRVQEKLNNSGLKKWHSGEENSGDIYVFTSGKEYTFDKLRNGSAYDENAEHITANEFLGEKVTPSRETVADSINTWSQDQRIYGISIAEQIEALEKSISSEKIINNNKPKNKFMENIVAYFNDLTVSAEDKELRKAGLKDQELNWTRETLEIVRNLEAKELGYKNWEDIKEKTGNNNGLSQLEVHTLLTKYYDKLLDTAKKFNKRDEKKTK